MARTNALFLATEEYYGTPDDTAQEVEYFWNQDVSPDGDYDISISTDRSASLDDPSTLGEALEDVYNDSTVQQKLDSYDAVVVIDDRNVSGGSGIAKVGTVGTDTAIGYCESYDKQTAAHELAHIYGVSHDDDDTHWQNFGVWSHDVMGYEGVAPSCHDEDPDMVREMRYWDCARERIQEIIDQKL